MIIGYLAVRQAGRRNQATAAAGRNGRGARRPQRSHKSERVEATAGLIQKLPIKVHHTKEELSSKSISQLKSLLKEEIEEDDSENYDGSSFPVRKATPFLEKEDLIEALLGPVASRPQDSSAESCSICCEEYVCGDLKRVLRHCSHQFHVECVDRWFLSSTDYSNRPASCPMCNAELKEEG